MLLVFDYDGTLHDTARLYGSAVRKAYSQLVKAGYAQERFYSDQQLSKYLGMTPGEMWADFMPDLPQSIMKQASDNIGFEMTSQIQNGSAHLYSGIRQALDTLKTDGHTMVILSNCKNQYMAAHRKYFNLDKWFEKYYCAEEYGFIPKEVIFNFIADDYPDKKYIVIGDRESDIKAAAEHGAFSIGCLYGFGCKEELADCDVIIDNPSKLVDTIRNYSYGL